jgi:hypothetical protein
MEMAVIVPYRDREEHLEKFVPYMQEYLDQPFSIFVIEQEPGQRFNRGKLMNVGFDIAKNDYDWFCFHDVDLLPEDISYNYPEDPIHLGARLEQNNFEMPYPTFFGGVNMFCKEDFELVNGFPNDYWGWGWEECDLRLRCELAGLTISRPKQGKFKSLPHEYPHLAKNNGQVTYQDWVLENSARYQAFATLHGATINEPLVPTEAAEPRDSKTGL